MLNLCASLVLAYVVFISSVEQTDNEVRTLTLIITIKSAMTYNRNVEKKCGSQGKKRSTVTLTELLFKKCFKLQNK